jgi:trehalose 6-phosphate synthase
VASNRGPVTFERGEDGTLEARRGAGGLVTALLGAMSRVGGLWVAAAISEADRELARGPGGGRMRMASPSGAYEVRLLDVPPERYDGYYNRISNGILWFAHHYLWDTVRQPIFDEAADAAWNDYVAVNRQFAEALAEEAERLGDPCVFLVQDYHLALVPRLLRELRPDAHIAHFSHTAIAGLTYLRIVPVKIREGVLRGMLGADVLGFHSQMWAENFLSSARSLPGVRGDLLRSRLVTEGREVAVRIHPISIDPAAMRADAATPEVARLRRELNRWRGDNRLILRVDRLELSKNIVRGFRAYALFLRTHPEWRRRVRFLALLSPSRMDLPEYREYGAECLAAAEEVNREFGEEGWQPVEVRVKDDHPGALAAYGIYDVLLVNPIFDGMNLVAMEGPLLNRRGGVLVLSRNAGAYWRMGRHALAINPFDLRETAEAIAHALEMPREERLRRARNLSRLVLTNPPERWVRAQLEDLERARRRRGRIRRP